MIERRMRRLRDAHQGPGAGRGDRPGAVRAAGGGAGHLPVARAVPVPGPGPAAMADLFGCAPSPGALAAMTRKIAGLIAPALDAVLKALLGAEVAHFDETGFRVAGKLAWVHSASSGKFVLVTVHAKRGKEGMDAAGVLPSFAGIACHDAWAPYDCYQDVAGHALCNAHLLRELTAVTETGTADDVIWAQAGHRRAAGPEAGRRCRPCRRARRHRPGSPGQARPLVPRRGRRRDHAERRPPQRAAQETPRPGHPDGQPHR